MVPFFRAVRVKKMGREAIPPPWGRSPPLKGREATLTLQGVALRSPVFANEVVLNVARFG